MIEVIEVNNVHQALPEACFRLSLQNEERSSRNGKVRVFLGPLATTYLDPRNRVLFWAERDANPFFHLFEALWMLAGRNDVEFVQRYNSQIGQFSDDGQRFNAAYGYRWRHHFGRDQLESIASSLRANPSCRRQVLTMWDPVDLGSSSKDVACNTTAYFQVDNDGRLDMMVCNRSNDLIWGAYGANAVHFSVLQEYLATLIGVRVGRYHQVSMNAHVYERHWDLVETLAREVSDWGDAPADPYDKVIAFPLMNVASHVWDAELSRFLGPIGEADLDRLTDPFFHNVCRPMELAWRAFKDKSLGDERIPKALEHLGEMPENDDWRLACTEWLQRRAR